MAMLLDKYKPEGRRRRRQARGERNGVLGWMFLAAFATIAAGHWMMPVEETSLGLMAGPDRRNLEIFITQPEQCEGTETWYAAPFFAIMCYSFIGLAVVTDEYFEPTLALISKDLGLSPDVAGATFMAAGSSAPELLTSLVDAFFSKASVGVGTILGSAMFNMLIIIGGSALIGKSKDGGPLLISGYPLGRDSLFYLLALGVLTGLMLNDGKLCVMADDRFDIFVNRTDQADKDVLCYVGLVTTVEGLLLVLFYVAYIVVMVYNRQIHTWVHENIQFLWCSKIGKPTKRTQQDLDLSNLQADMEKHRDRLRADSWNDGESGERSSAESEVTEDSFDEDEADFPGNPLTSGNPESIGGYIYWFLAFPFRMLFFLTMPTFLSDGKVKNFLLFTVNIVWITALTFLMVYFSTFGGCLLDVDPFIIGIIFLAVGTSVPDALASFIVAKRGHGDMAISNALGSNVFDIFLGLGLPWFLSGLIFPNQVRTAEGFRGGNFVITNGYLLGIFLLVGGLFLFLGGLILFKWRMVKPLALMLVLYYVAFLFVIILANRCQIPICIELDCSRCGFEPSLI